MQRVLNDARIVETCCAQLIYDDENVKTKRVNSDL
jgi:hypothetical protein